MLHTGEEPHAISLSITNIYDAVRLSADTQWLFKVRSCMLKLVCPGCLRHFQQTEVNLQIPSNAIS